METCNYIKQSTKRNYIKGLFTKLSKYYGCKDTLYIFINLYMYIESMLTSIDFTKKFLKILFP